MKNEIKRALKKILKREIELETPPDNKLGDYAFPCFSLAKEFKKNPSEIARELLGKIKGNFRVETKGPYVNFFVDKVKLSELVLGNITREKEKYGHGKVKGKKILVESPGPNTNKPLHLGHLRNIFLGSAIRNILSANGNNVLIVDIVNDRGIHIANSMLAYKLYGKNKKPDVKSDHFVGRFYVLYAKNENEELKKKAQQLLVKWENGDKETIALWKKMNKWALNGFKETYNTLGFKVDKTYFESEHYKEGREIVYKGLKKGIFKKNEKGVVVDLTMHGLDEKVLLREDGTSVYVTQDISLAIKRYKDFKMDEMIYVVGNEQIYHFKVLFKILELLGYKFAKNCYHLAYGMVNLPEGKMKSREGKVVDADDLIDEMIELARKETKKRYSKISNKELEKRSRIIGLGALRFFILKFDPLKDVLFNPEESISFEGDTGPYVQYAYVRCNSILKKAKFGGKTDYGLFNDYDNELVKMLELFPSAVERAGKEYKPSLIAHYLLELSKKFNEFYSKNPVLNAEGLLKNSRLKLVSCVRQVLKNGLFLLGVGAPKEM